MMPTDDATTAATATATERGRGRRSRNAPAVLLLLSASPAEPALGVPGAAATNAAYAPLVRWSPPSSARRRLPGRGLGRTGHASDVAGTSTRAEMCQRNRSPRSCAPSMRRNDECDGPPPPPDDLPFAALVVAGALSASAAAAVALWSEISVALTRCGPVELADWAERSAFLSVLVVSAASIWTRIFARAGLIESASLADVLLGVRGAEDAEDGSGARSDAAVMWDAVTTLLASAEALSLIAALGAVVVLAVEVANGDALADGAGLTGIDVLACRLLREGG